MSMEFKPIKVKCWVCGKMRPSFFGCTFEDPRPDRDICEKCFWLPYKLLRNQRIRKFNNANVRKVSRPESAKCS